MSGTKKSGAGVKPIRPPEERCETIVHSFVRTQRCPTCNHRIAPERREHQCINRWAAVCHECKKRFCGNHGAYIGSANGRGRAPHLCGACAHGAEMA